VPTLRLATGRALEEVALPDTAFAGILKPKLDPAGPPAKVLARALDAPVGALTLERAFPGARRATVVIPDRTRNSAQDRYLPLIVRRLADAGISPERITVLFANGTHRGHTPEERAAIAGPLPPGVALVDHDGADSNALVALGRTPAGTDVAVNRLAVETDALVLTGTMSFHYLAGYGGGRKCFAPGVAAHDTCVALHRRTLDPSGTSVRHPACVPGRLDGNPFHEDLMAACALAPVRPWLFHTLLAPCGGIVGAFAGGVREAHLAAVAPWDRAYRIRLERPADLVVASCGGHPKDINLYQAHKSALHAVRALRPGGTLVLLAACPDGPGAPAFAKWFDLPDLDTHADTLRAAFEIPGQTAWSLRDLAARYRIRLVSGLDPAFVARTGMQHAASAREAVAQALAELPADAVTCAIPEAGWVLPDTGTSAFPNP